MSFARFISFWCKSRFVWNHIMIELSEISKLVKYLRLLGELLESFFLPNFHQILSFSCILQFTFIVVCFFFFFYFVICSFFVLFFFCCNHIYVNLRNDDNLHQATKTQIGRLKVWKCELMS